MEENYECDYCDKTFPEENAMIQHQRAVHPHEVSTPSGDGLAKHWFILGGLIVVLAGLLYVYGGSIVAWWTTGEYPTINDHWHSPYEVVICGEKLSPFARQEGDIHTHGNGLIHIHPHSEKTAGKAANLGAFMKSVDGVISDTHLVVPNRGIYENGDLCPDGEPGKVQVFVDGKKVPDPDGYVPGDGEKIVIMFGPETEKLSK